VLRLRNRHPAFHRRGFYRGQPVNASGRKDIAWIRPDGHEMQPDDWSRDGRTIGFFLAAHPMICVVMNAAPDDVQFALPDVQRVTWSLVLDTSIEGGEQRDVEGDEVVVYPLLSRSLAVFAGRVR
jgi:glycogen operon protein